MFYAFGFYRHFLQHLTRTSFLWLYFQANMKMCWQITPYIRPPTSFVGICNTNQDRVRPTIRSDDLQNARSSGYMYRQSCVTPTAYQTFMCPEIVQSFERLYGRNETEAFQYSVRNPLLSLAVVTFTAITQTVSRVWGKKKKKKCNAKWRFREQKPSSWSSCFQRVWSNCSVVAWKPVFEPTSLF